MFPRQIPSQLCRGAVSTLFKRKTPCSSTRHFSTSPFVTMESQTAQPINTAASSQDATQQLLNKPKPWEDAALLGKHAQKPESKPLTGPNQLTGEVHGPQGPEPTRYGDFERSGRCYDF